MTNTDAAPQPSSSSSSAQPQHDEIHVLKTEKPHNRLVAIAVDGSKHSEYAFNWAVKNFVRPDSDQLMLIHARPIVKYSYSPMISDVEEFDRKESFDLLHKFAGALPSDNKYNVRLVSMSGDPRETIASKVDSENADVLIVGSHGRGPIRKALLGSVSDHLVKHVKAPVIVSRPEPVEPPAKEVPPFDMLSLGVVPGF
ncbi:hypothetical protein DFJ73DRAFT_859237 [Zopfochytrium polystomum]|nr:hypothetical protein DFJ73DRAFT_859237 [Zopfochytrium polystomum]